MTFFCGAAVHLGARLLIVEVYTSQKIRYTHSAGLL
jgi:hypothetical protein